MSDTVGTFTGSGGTSSSDSSQMASNNYKNDPVNTYSPWGSVTYQSGRDDRNEKVWNQTTTLSPTEQYKLDAQNQAQMALINAVMGRGTYTQAGGGIAPQYNSSSVTTPVSGGTSGGSSSGGTVKGGTTSGGGGTTTTNNYPAGSVKWYSDGIYSFPSTGKAGSTYTVDKKTGAYVKYNNSGNFDGTYYYPQTQVDDMGNSVNNGYMTSKPNQSNFTTSYRDANGNKVNPVSTTTTTKTQNPDYGQPTYDYTFDTGSSSPIAQAIQDALKPLDTSKQWDLNSRTLAADMGYDTTNASYDLPWEYQSDPLTQNNITKKSYNTTPLDTGKSASMNWNTNALSNNYFNKYTTDAGLNNNYTYNVDIDDSYTRNVDIDPSKYTTNVNIDPSKYVDNVNIDPSKYTGNVNIDADKYQSGVNYDDSYSKGVDYRQNYTDNVNVNDNYTRNITDQMNGQYSHDYLSKLDDYNYTKNAMLGDEYDTAYNRLFNTYSQGFQEDQDRLLNNLEQKLANQGLALGNQAYNQSMTDYNNNYYKQYNKLQQQAASDAYSYALQNANLRNAATQSQAENQLANEQLNNAATAKEYENYLSDANLNNSVLNALNNYQFQNAELRNDVLSRLNNYDYQNSELNNSALTQMNNYDFQNADLNNQVQNWLNTYAFQNADLSNNVQNWLNDYAFKNADLKNSVQNWLNDYAFQNANLNNQVQNWLNDYAFQNANLNNSVVTQLNDYAFQNAALNNEAVNSYNQNALANANLNNAAQDSINNLALQNAELANTAKDKASSYDIAQASLANEAINSYMQGLLTQQNQNNSALSDLTKNRVAAQTVVNDAIANAYNQAGTLNNQAIQQQMAQNAYMYNMLYSLLGGTSVTMPSGYSGAALSGSGASSAAGSAGTSSSSGGLLNSLGNWLW